MGATALWYAACNGHPDVVHLLLWHGADMNKADSKGWTPLLIACRRGHLDVVRLLVQSGVDVNLGNTGKGGRTALGCAAWKGHSDIVQLLVDKGADHTIAGKWGTPLNEAKPECAAILRAAGARA